MERAPWLELVGAWAGLAEVSSNVEALELAAGLHVRH